MQQSIGRITAWIRTHPWVAAVLLGVVAIAAVLYLRSKGGASTTVSQTPATTPTDTTGAAVPPPTPTPTPNPTIIPEPLPLPIFEGGSGFGGHHGSGGGGGSGGSTAGATALPASPLTTDTTQPNVSVAPGTYYVTGSEISVVANPAEYSAGAVLASPTLARMTAMANSMFPSASVAGKPVTNVSARNQAQAATLALKPGYQSRLAAEYGQTQPSGRTAAVIGSANMANVRAGLQPSGAPRVTGKAVGIRKGTVATGSKVKER